MPPQASSTSKGKSPLTKRAAAERSRSDSRSSRSSSSSRAARRQEKDNKSGKSRTSRKRSASKSRHRSRSRQRGRRSKSTSRRRSKSKSRSRRRRSKSKSRSRRRSRSPRRTDKSSRARSKSRSRSRSPSRRNGGRRKRSRTRSRSVSANRYRSRTRARNGHSRSRSRSVKRSRRHSPAYGSQGRRSTPPPMSFGDLVRSRASKQARNQVEPVSSSTKQDDQPRTSKSAVNASTGGPTREHADPRRNGLLPIARPTNIRRSKLADQSPSESLRHRPDPAAGSGDRNQRSCGAPQEDRGSPWSSEAGSPLASPIVGRSNRPAVGNDSADLKQRKRKSTISPAKQPRPSAIKAPKVASQSPSNCASQFIDAPANAVASTDRSSQHVNPVNDSAQIHTEQSRRHGVGSNGVPANCGAPRIDANQSPSTKGPRRSRTSNASHGLATESPTCTGISTEVPPAQRIVSPAEELSGTSRDNDRPAPRLDLRRPAVPGSAELLSSSTEPLATSLEKTEDGEPETLAEGLLQRWMSSDWVPPTHEPRADHCAEANRIFLVGGHSDIRSRFRFDDLGLPNFAGRLRDLHLKHERETDLRLGRAYAQQVSVNRNKTKEFNLGLKASVLESKVNFLKQLRQQLEGSSDAGPSAIAAHFSSNDKMAVSNSTKSPTGGASGGSATALPSLSPWKSTLRLSQRVAGIPTSGDEKASEPPTFAKAGSAGGISACAPPAVDSTSAWRRRQRSGGTRVQSSALSPSSSSSHCPSTVQLSKSSGPLSSPAAPVRKSASAAAPLVASTLH